VREALTFALSYETRDRASRARSDWQSRRDPQRALEEQGVRVWRDPGRTDAELAVEDLGGHSAAQKRGSAPMIATALHASPRRP